MTSKKNLPDVAARLKEAIAARRAALPVKQRLFGEYLSQQEGDCHSDTVRHLYLSGFEPEYLDPFVKNLMEEIENTDDPSLELNFVISELQGVLKNLRHIQDGFAAFAARSAEVTP